MSRHLLFVLLLTTAVTLAAEEPQTQSADGAAVTQKKTKPAQRRTDKEHAKPESAQPGNQEPQPKEEDAQEQTEKEQAKPNEGAKLTSVPDAKALGMSILGNQDAPKSLVIVPWKTSELGDSPGISPILDDSRQPVDKEVFMRALRYYDIRSKTKP